MARYVFVPGDPGRVRRIAERFDEAWEVGRNREYSVWTGRAGGVLMSAVSTGIGCPSTAIAVEELRRLGAETFIRLGTAGGIQTAQERGELVISHGAIRDEGTSHQYVPAEFPAVAHPDTTRALRSAASELGVRHQIGLAQSKDSFYGEVEPDRQPVAPRLRGRWSAWRAGGGAASEMEAATLFVLGQIYGLRAGAATVISPRTPDDLDPLIAVGVRAVQLLAEEDERRGEKSGRVTDGARGRE